MTESFDNGEWMTGFVGVYLPNLGGHFPMVIRNEAIARGMTAVAMAHAQRTNQTTWWRRFTHYVDDEAIYLRREGTMPK